MLQTEFISNTSIVEGREWPAEEEFVAEPASAAQGPESSLDAESLFAADLSATALLTPAEENALARQIARARKRVRAILRRAKGLTRAALPEAGRGIVRPDEDFREREAVIILRFAQDLLRHRRPLPGRGMTRSKLRQFVDDLSGALAEYRAPRDKMIRANVRLVNVLARRYRHPTMSFLDLFQEGAVGLFRAVEKYDPDRHIKFSTYATWWIWQQLGRAADVQGSLIRTPVHWNQLRRRLSRSAHAAAPDRLLSRKTVAELEGIDPGRIEVMGQPFHFVSTDAALSDDDDRGLESLIPGSEEEPETHVIQATLRTHLERALEQLPAREQLILRHRFGMDNDDEQTLDQLGTRLGVSRERVRQLESRALRQLRDVCAANGLRDYLH
jgi:RNA polymerase primary sigma factor